MNLVNDKFNQSLTIEQIKSFIANHKLKTGRTGYFPKGNIPFNKGRKGYCPSGCEKGWFKPGQRPVNWRSLGSERVNVDGYIEIKVSNTATPVQRRWKCKHVVIWEKAHGKVPKGYVVVFLDGNKLNTALDNLMMISRKAHAIMCHLNWYTNDKDVTKANCLMAEIKAAISDRKRKTFEDKKNKKMVFIDNHNQRIVVAQVIGKDKWVAARETKQGLQKLRAIKVRNSLEKANRELYEYAMNMRGWQRI